MLSGHHPIRLLDRRCWRRCERRQPHLVGLACRPFRSTVVISSARALAAVPPTLATVMPRESPITASINTHVGLHQARQRQRSSAASAQAAKPSSAPTGDLRPRRCGHERVRLMRESHVGQVRGSVTSTKFDADRLGAEACVSTNGRRLGLTVISKLHSTVRSAESATRVRRFSASQRFRPVAHTVTSAPRRRDRGLGCAHVVDSVCRREVSSCELVTRTRCRRLSQPITMPEDRQSMA